MRRIYILSSSCHSAKLELDRVSDGRLCLPDSQLSRRKSSDVIRRGCSNWQYSVRVSASFCEGKRNLRRLFKRLISNSGLVIPTSSSVLNKVKEIDRKIDELRGFLEDVFLTPEEYRLLREVDNTVKERKLSELTPLDEVQSSTS